MAPAGGPAPPVGWWRRYLLPATVAVLLFWLALKGGAYGLGIRSNFAIVGSVFVALAVGLGAWPRARIPTPSVVVAGLLGAFALLQALSMAWADSAEHAFTEFNRVALYLVVFTAVVASARQASVRSWALGLSVGIAAVGVLALVSRLFPDLIGETAIQELNPGDPRLSYPLNYWNGLSSLIALGIPLLLAAASEASSRRTAAVALAPIPALATAMYFTSSRGGAGAALIGIAAFIALTRPRVQALAAAAVAFAGTAISIIYLQGQTELVNRPDADAAVGQGRSAAVVIVLACAATAFAWSFVRPRLPAEVTIAPRVRRVAIGIAAVLVLAAAATADLPGRFEDLKRPPERFESDYVQSHILSSGGNGRWQFWSAAYEEFETRPVFGRGAGSFSAWWLEHGTIAYFTRNAHSLFLETLGELGAVGLLLLLALIAAGLVIALRRVRAAPDEARAPVAAFAAVFIAFVVAAATDWVWDLTVVALVGIVVLGVLAGPATVFPDEAPPRFSWANARRGAVWRALVAVAMLGVAVAHAIPHMAQEKIRDSQEELKQGDVDASLAAAHDARGWQGWAASTHLQVALVEEHRRRFDDARVSIDRAIDRDPSDWQIWAVASRIAQSAGDDEEARRAFERARSLNPRSRFFADERDGRTED